MDHNSLIDMETYEVHTHAEDCPRMFICDKLIANAVATLNKKGYKTFASCQGHYRLEFYEYFNEDISKLEDMRKDDHIIIKNVRDAGFDYWREATYTGPYVLFDNEYDFDSLPDGFELEISNDRSHIFHDISYYYDNIKRTYKSVQEEIEKYCKILERWANDLPERKE